MMARLDPSSSQQLRIFTTSLHVRLAVVGDIFNGRKGGAQKIQRFSRACKKIKEHDDARQVIKQKVMALEDDVRAHHQPFISCSEPSLAEIYKPQKKKTAVGPCDGLGVRYPPARISGSYKYYTLLFCSAFVFRPPPLFRTFLQQCIQQ